jgi:hypothetical protein
VTPHEKTSSGARVDVYEIVASPCHKPKIGSSFVAATRHIAGMIVMEHSLVVIKPDGTIRRTVGALVLKDLMDRGFRVKAFKEMKVSESLAKLHYDVHKEKPFFPWLRPMMSYRAFVMHLVLHLCRKQHLTPLEGSMGFGLVSI